jgi:hypothetical protein
MRQDLEEMTMSSEIAKLEQAWLQAEALAEKAKHDARQARVAGTRKVSNGNGSTVALILDPTDELDRRHADAERRASELFDRLWTAKELRSADA